MVKSFNRLTLLLGVIFFTPCYNPMLYPCWKVCEKPITIKKKNNHSCYGRICPSPHGSVRHGNWWLEGHGSIQSQRGEYWSSLEISFPLQRDVMWRSLYIIYSKYIYILKIYIYIYILICLIVCLIQYDTLITRNTYTFLKQIATIKLQLLWSQKWTKTSNMFQLWSQGSG